MPQAAATGSRFSVFSLLVIALAAATVSGCGQPLTPQATAERFWRAVVASQPTKIRRYVRQQDLDLLKGDPEILAVATFTLKRILIDGAQANIETQVVLDGDTPLPLNIETRLVFENEQWRVDYQATVNEISEQSSLAQVIGKIGAIGESLKQGIEQSVDDATAALPAIEQELSRLEAQIKQAMPELREKLETFSRRLEEVIKTPPKSISPDPEPGDFGQPPPAEGDGTIAL